MFARVDYISNIVDDMMTERMKFKVRSLMRKEYDCFVLIMLIIIKRQRSTRTLLTRPQLVKG